MNSTGVLRRFAPAKLNLFLHVGDKRADGYHDLLSLAVFADVGDWLTLAPARTLSLRITGPFAPDLTADDSNLVLKAARALVSWAEAHGVKTHGVDLSLEKNLPIASGIGGGSSDAAATLLALAEHWALPIGIDELHAIGRTLGADVPVCLFARPAYMLGIGDELKALTNVPPFALLLVNPGIHVATAPVFAALRTRSGTFEPKAFKGASAHDFALWLDALSNDLAAPATILAPVITSVEAAITATDGCLLARMSGSGATCFGIYATHEEAVAAAAVIAQAQPHWWVKAARTYSCLG
ncbi:MAG: 4-(cytidine 5'-diphospho)-2-C-methyl-D-erythritol kinase [Alphaproteobacteria bacterium]|nr:4-(cytidine 5'-diphospho)-2-C-methyl-D-erythritol kinase [Alphaproteobacteria bacterium]